MNRFILGVLGIAACSTARKVPHLDASTPGDTSSASDGDVPRDAAVDAPGPDSSAPYRHTITIDGDDDFAAVENIPTTSAAYTARVTWDDTTLYIGYRGPDLEATALDADQKWLFAYVDVDPGASTGAIQSVTYRTQHATLPTGFGAEYYARRKCDDSFSSFEAYAGTMWSAAAPISFGHAGTFVELAIPRSLFGGATTVGVVTWMINEKADFEGSFAGLYATNFADGYAMTLPLTQYIRVDFESPLAPSDLAYRAP